jgi:hypothetical protein
MSSWLERRLEMTNVHQLLHPLYNIPYFNDIILQHSQNSAIAAMGWVGGWVGQVVSG